MYPILLGLIILTSSFVINCIIYFYRTLPFGTYFVNLLCLSMFTRLFKVIGGKNEWLIYNLGLKLLFASLT
jgi:hypothetical protein